MNSENLEQIFDMLSDDTRSLFLSDLYDIEENKEWVLSKLSDFKSNMFYRFNSKKLSIGEKIMNENPDLGVRMLSTFGGWTQFITEKFFNQILATLDSTEKWKGLLSWAPDLKDLNQKSAILKKEISNLSYGDSWLLRSKADSLDQDIKSIANKYMALFQKVSSASFNALLDNVKGCLTEELLKSILTQEGEKAYKNRELLHYKNLLDFGMDNHDVLFRGLASSIRSVSYKPEEEAFIKEVFHFLTTCNISMPASFRKDLIESHLWSGNMALLNQVTQHFDFIDDKQSLKAFIYKSFEHKPSHVETIIQAHLDIFNNFTDADKRECLKKAILSKDLSLASLIAEKVPLRTLSLLKKSMQNNSLEEQMSIVESLILSRSTKTQVIHQPRRRL